MQKRILDEIEASLPRVLVLSFDGTLWSAPPNFSKNRRAAINEAKVEESKIISFVEK